MVTFESRAMVRDLFFSKELHMKKFGALLLVLCLFMTSIASANDAWRNPGPFPDGMDTRMEAYDASASGTGALPQANCGGHPAFPNGFIDPDNTSNVLFQ